MNNVDTLKTFGGTSLPHIKRWFPLPTSVTCSLQEAAIPDDAGLFAVAVRVRVDTGTAVVSLTTVDGPSQDKVECKARRAVYEFVLFASCIGTGIRVDVTPSPPTAEAAILQAEVMSLSSLCIAAENLMHHRCLVADPSWGYGRPALEDTAGRLRDRAFATIAVPAPVRWLNELTIFLEPGDQLSRVLMITGLYEPATMMVLRELLPKGGAFVDVGAHCGCYTLFAASCVGPAGVIVSFEPSPRECARLTANVALNALTQVDIRQVAVTDAPGPIELRIAEASYAGHNTAGARFAYDGVRTDRIAQVAGTTLDLALADLMRCDAIKLDIEGGELRALQGACKTIERFRPTLVLEIFEAALRAFENSAADITSWLHAHDYILYEIEHASGALRPADEVLPPDVSRNFVALPRNTVPPRKSQ